MAFIKLKQQALKFLIKLFPQEKFGGYYRAMKNLGNYGLNYGAGAGIEISGELIALQKVMEVLSTNECQEPWLFVDAGAHKGEYTDRILRLSREKEFTLLAMEPVPVFYDALKDRFKGVDAVECLNIGLDEVKGTKSIYYIPNREGSTSMHFHKGALNFASDKEVNRLEARFDALDHIFEEKNWPILHFLKLDLEGNEFYALKGAERLLNASKLLVIQFEFGEHNINSRVFFKDFFDLLNPGFQIFRILKKGFYPISEYDPELEVFKTSNFICFSRKLNLTGILPR